MVRTEVWTLAISQKRYRKGGIIKVSEKKITCYKMWISFAVLMIIFTAGLEKVVQRL